MNGRAGSVGGNPRDKSIAVLGAGAAGLCAAKTLLEAGFSDITVYEIGTQIGQRRIEPASIKALLIAVRARSIRRTRSRPLTEPSPPEPLRPKLTSA